MTFAFILTHHCSPQATPHSLYTCCHRDTWQQMAMLIFLINIYLKQLFVLVVSTVYCVQQKAQLFPTYLMFIITFVTKCLKIQTMIQFRERCDLEDIGSECNNTHPGSHSTHEWVVSYKFPEICINFRKFVQFSRKFVQFFRKFVHSETS